MRIESGSFPEEKVKNELTLVLGESNCFLIEPFSLDMKVWTILNPQRSQFCEGFYLDGELFFAFPISDPVQILPGAWRAAAASLLGKVLPAP